MSFILVTNSNVLFSGLQIDIVPPCTILNLPDLKYVSPFDIFHYAIFCMAIMVMPISGIQRLISAVKCPDLSTTLGNAEVTFEGTALKLSPAPLPIKLVGVLKGTRQDISFTKPLQFLKSKILISWLHVMKYY